MLRETPGVGADAWDWLLFDQAGVVATAQAVGLLGRAAVRTHLSRGRWRTICRGVLLTENGRLWRDQQLWVAILAAGDGACLAGATAAIEGGIRGLRSDPVDVLVPTARNGMGRLARMPLDMPVVRAHRTSVLPEHHLRPGRPPRTTVARAVLDAAAWAGSDREATAIILTACQQRRVLPGELWRALGDLSRVRRRRLIAATVSDAEGGADSLSEIDLIALCRRHRLPKPEQQRRRRDASGRNRFLDAYWPDARLHVEVDGAHHMEVRHWADDMLRQNEVWMTGDRILRFPAWLIRSDPAAVAGQLRLALATPPPRMW